MNTVQDKKVEAESMKARQTEIKLIIKIWKADKNFRGKPLQHRTKHGRQNLRH